MATKPTTRGDVLHLTIAQAVDSGLRLLVPVFLVRILSQDEFGEYRLFWLLANSLVLILPLGISRSLLFFLPRSSDEERRRYLCQTTAYLAMVILPVSVVLVWAPQWLPDNIATLTDPQWVLGAFTLVWFVSSLITILPNADRNIVWQKWAIIGLAVTRSLCVLGTAYWTRDLDKIFISLLAFVVIQAMVFVYYVAGHYGMKLVMPTGASIRRQVTYAIPFGLSGSLSNARPKIEQWIVAFLFAPGSLAIMSIAGGFSGILKILRTSVGSVLLPKMSKTHAGGDVMRSLALNNRGNIAIAYLIFPIVVCVWVYAESLVTILYTAQYLEAVPLIRIYSVTMILMSVELATVLLIYEQGPFVAKTSGSILLFSAVLSYIGATRYGLPGVVIGSVIGTFFNRIINFRKAASVLKVPFSKVQDWPTLGKLLAAAILSGGISRLAVEFIGVSDKPFLAILAGAPLLGISFLLLTFIFRVHWVLLSMLGRATWPDVRAS
jgi:O-antigen/teichoic acid export membrane protein